MVLELSSLISGFSGFMMINHCTLAYINTDGGVTYPFFRQVLISKKDHLFEIKTAQMLFYLFVSLQKA